MFGFSDKNVVAGELDSGALNAKGTRFDWDLGDDIRAGVYSLFGKDYSRETLRAAAIAEQTRRINEQLDPLNGSLASYGPGLSISRNPGETGAQTLQRAKDAVALQQSIASTKVEIPGIDLSGVSTIHDLTSRVSAHNQKLKNKQEEKESNAREEERNRYWTDRADRREQQIREWEGKQDNIKLNLASAADTRASNERIELARIEGSLDQARLENARLLQAEENRRLDRKDKAMMSLIGAGQNALGLAFGLAF